MDLKTAILEAKYPNKEYAFVCRKGFKWYLKVDWYSSTKYFKNGQPHTQEFLCMEDYLAEDWVVMSDRYVIR